MTISLHTLVDDVRFMCGDISSDYVTDYVIYKMLKQSYRYVNKLSCEEVDEEDLSDAIVSLATYYTYLSYVSLSARDLGDIPLEMHDMTLERKRIAYNDILMISCIPITPDLNIDEKRLQSTPITNTLTDSVFI